MKSSEPSIISFALSNIDNGFLFEDFVKEFMSASDGMTFIPVGGIHDKGIDGLEFTYNAGNISKKIYQFSIEKNPRDKIRRTLNTLAAHSIELQRLVYATNVLISEPSILIDEIFTEYNVFLEPRDLNWFSVNVNSSPQTVSIFQRFEERNYQVYSKINKALEPLNVKDPRIYVYLRQQIEHAGYTSRLDEILIDTLIFMALDDTDPNKGILSSKERILELISDITNFEPKWLSEMVSVRLEKLSTKPLRKVKHHRQVKKYCLPYETRVEIAERQLSDQVLYQAFTDITSDRLLSELKKNDVVVQNSQKLLEQVFHRLFSQQGLEFSQFITTGDGSHSLDKALQPLISSVIEDSSVIVPNRPQVRVALLNTIRNIIYRGSVEELEFLRRLADTYKMLFLLQCDPKLASFFEVLAKDLHVYVDTSILIPALSEYFLESKNRRYSNLLVAARDAGVDLIVNHTIMAELAAHFRNTQRDFLEHYMNREDLYDNEVALVYVPEILIRAYFYARLYGKVEHFNEFFENFVSSNQSTHMADLIEWLKEAFGIRYEETKNLGLKTNPKEEEILFEELKKYKASIKQARNDAKQLLMIYALRERNNELGEGGAFGYKTWWLTSDINSQQAFKKVASKSLTRTSPYIRADFLYNYISLAPSKKRVTDIYQKVFPTLLGVNISIHIPTELNDIIQESLQIHKAIVDTPSFKGKLRAFTEQLKSDPAQWDKKKIKHWFEERAREIKGETLTSE